jgi:acylphosphatase
VTTCCRYIVHGRVQGVFFRDSTRSAAISLDISGHAVNLPDGTVEVLACGEESGLQQLEEWLQSGPPAAQVTEVRKYRLDRSGCEPARGFSCG